MPSKKHGASWQRHRAERYGERRKHKRNAPLDRQYEQEGRRTLEDHELGDDQITKEP